MTAHVGHEDAVMQILADVELCKFYLRLCKACADDVDVKMDVKTYIC